jgi:hypothetical protein
MEPNSTKEATDYLYVLQALIPPVIIGAIVAIITGAKKLHKLPTRKRIIMDICLTALVGASAALMAVCIAPLLADNISSKVEIGIAALAGSFGQKAFDLMKDKLSGAPSRYGDSQNY